MKYFYTRHKANLQQVAVRIPNLRVNHRGSALCTAVYARMYPSTWYVCMCDQRQDSIISTVLGLFVVDSVVGALEQRDRRRLSIVSCTSSPSNIFNNNNIMIPITCTDRHRETPLFRSRNTLIFFFCKLENNVNINIYSYLYNNN